MAESVVERIKETFEGIIEDRKTLVKILSVMLILLIAAVLRIHDISKADIAIVTAENDGEQGIEETMTEMDKEIIYVDISGAVNDPGVYQVSKETRLYEVIEMAGGLAEDADTDSVNRASFVEDGQKIIIPVKGSDKTGSTAGLSESGSAVTDGRGLVNINTASLDELKTLNGIGDVMAERIIEYRSSRTFKSKEDIMSVEGIGKGTYEKIKDRIIY